MLTIENLRKFGANTDKGVARCLDSEEFYLELVQSVLEDGDPSSLRQALEAKRTQGTPLNLHMRSRAFIPISHSRRCSLPQAS